MINQDMQYDEFCLKSKVFLDRLDKNLSTSELKIMPHWSIDHICYRSDTIEKYNLLKVIFSKFATKLIESNINGRAITTFKLHKPLQYSKWKIDLLELPAPKPGKQTAEGFEHIEVVSNRSFNELSKTLQNFPIKKNGLDKDFNPELACNINGSNIKFHHISLESVVNMEANTKVFHSILNTNILKKLKQYNPKIIGALPLGLHIDSYGVDILLCSDDLPALAILIREYYGEYQNFNTSLEDNNQHLSISFTFNDIPLKLYAEKNSTLKQQAFKCFQIEERLLKLGSPHFRKKIKQSTKQGLKTEDAFTKALGLSGDSSIELLKIFEYSEQELIDSFSII